MTPSPEKPQKETGKPKTPCGTGCPDFVAKTCSGDDPQCAIYWRFSQGLR
ncbi:MAG TPA: hypothetical protein VEI81_06450 [Methanoregula sp.]|nr:hypothetical protein [Methanoregula sp.]